ncbi:MAG: hypothetical protein R3C44_05155 [Chloroflexota bacterium]
MIRVVIKDNSVTNGHPMKQICSMTCTSSRRIGNPIRQEWFTINWKTHLAVPPGAYQVSVSIVDVRTGNQLAGQTEAGDFCVVIPVGEVDIPQPETVVSAARVQIPQTADQTWLDGSLQLLGTGVIQAEALAGSRLPLDLFWHAPHGGLLSGLTLNWRLEPVEEGESLLIGETPLSRLDSASWRAGETVNEKVRLLLPAHIRRHNLVFELQNSSWRAD